MNGRVLVCIASRDRPDALVAAIDSILATSERADVAVYIDEDQYDLYQQFFARKDPRQKFVSGERVGPIGSLNRLSQLFKDYNAYGAGTDDCIFKTKDWDLWVLRESDRFPKQIGAMAPHHFGNRARMDFPYVTNAWIQTLGFFAYSLCYHFYWDVILEDLARSLDVARYATDEEFSIEHSDMKTESTGNIDRRAKNDAFVAINAIANDKPTLLGMLRSAINA